MSPKPLTDFRLREEDGLTVLRAAGACAVIEVLEGRPPRLLHYGADLGEAGDLGALPAALGRAAVPSSFDEPARPGIVPTEADGWLGRPGVAGHRNGRALMPLLAMTDTSREGDRLRITTADATTSGMASSKTAISIVSDIEMLPSGVLTLRHTLTNDGSSTLDLATLDVAVPFPPIATEVLDLSGRWCRERAPIRTSLLAGTRLREIRRGRTGHDSPLLMLVGTPGFGFGRGEVWGAHVAWSGDQMYAAERLPEGAGAGAGLLRGGELLRPGEVRLAQGERYESPTVWFTWSGDGIDGATRRLHAAIRSRPSHPARPRPVVLNTWEAVYFDHDLGRLTDLARVAARIGVERFVLDDGWFRNRRDDRAGLGDWEVDEAVWPGGLGTLFDEVRRLGMEVGLWVEPEMINLDSDLARAHPDWVLGPLGQGGRPPREWRHQQVLDLANPDAADHVFARLDALVTEHRLDFLKWDHNRDLSDAVDRLTGAASVHRQTLAAYALLDRLRTAHPGLEIESCSSGGGRIDLGILARTDRVWASDTTDPLERQEIERWTTLLLPPELIGSHVGPAVAHTTGRRTSLSFRCLTSLFGHAGIEWDVTRCTDAELERLTVWIALHKELRPLLHSAEVVRADDEPDGLRLRGVVAADRSAAVYSLVRLASALDAAPGPLRLPGLDPALRYRVRVRGDFFDARRRNRTPPQWWDAATGEGFVAGGAVLVSVGLQFPALMPGEGLLLHTVTAD